MSDSMQPWKLELTSSGESMGDGYIQGRIFQEDSLFPLPFVLCMILMTLILRKLGACDEQDDKGFRINNLFFIDLKLFVKNHQQRDSLVLTKHTFLQRIGGFLKGEILNM